MKKKKLLVLSLSVFIPFSTLLYSCSNTENTVQDVITGIEYSCPPQVGLGETTSISVDVIGSDDDSATFLSLNPDIATVSEAGVITGIKEGKATIKISAKNAPEIFKEFEIEVVGIIPESISLIIEESDGNVENGDNKIFLDLGSRVKFGIATNTKGAKEPNSISYKINNINSLPSDAQALELDQATGEFYACVAISGVIIEVDAYYSEANMNLRTSTLIVDIVNRNAEEESDIKNLFDKASETEGHSFLSASINREIKNNLTSEIKIKNTGFNSYKDFNYTVISSIENEEESKDYFFNGSYDGYDYAFDYDFKDEKAQINQFYVNEQHSENSKSNYVFEYDNGYIYGYSSLIYTRYFSSGELIDGYFYGFGHYKAKASAKYEFKEDEVLITSSFVDSDRSVSADLSFTLKFDNELNRILGYSFEENVKNLADSELNLDLSIKESSLDAIYGEKLEVEKTKDFYFDFEDFYFTDLKVKSRYGRYDKNDVNLKKFGYDSYDASTNTYRLSYDRTLVLELSSTNKSATSKIDHISVTSSNPDSIPNASEGSDGSFSISAKCDVNGTNYKPGEATFTFVTSKGYKEEVHVQFTEAGISDVYINDGTYNTEEGFVETVIKGEYSPYFFINNSPSDVKVGVTYSIKVISASNNNLNGISLYQYEDGNIDGYYGYAIKGNEVGTYEFKVVLTKGSATIESSRTYKIEVVRPYTAQEIKERIANKKYVYYTGTSSFLLEFSSETSLKISQTISGEEGALVDSISYHIEEGKILVDEDTLFQNITYFKGIKNGTIRFDRDFTFVQPYLEYRDNLDKDNLDDPTENYRGVKFKAYHEITKDNILDYIKNKSFKVTGTSEPNWGSGVTNPKFTLSFNDDFTGRLEVKDGLKVLCDLTFTFEVGESSKIPCLNILSSEGSKNETYITGFKYSTIDYLTTVSGDENNYYFLQVNLGVMKKYGSYSQEDRMVINFPIFG